jgi:hypothetical protein
MKAKQEVLKEQFYGNLMGVTGMLILIALITYIAAYV